MPAQLGYSTIGGSAAGIGVQQIYCQYTATGSFTATQISAYLALSGSATNVTFAIYADNAGSPGTLLGHTAGQSVPTGTGWVTGALTSGVAITNGQTYWLLFDWNNSVTTATFAYDVASGHNDVFSNNAYSAGSPPASNPSVTPWQTNWEFSIYASGGLSAGTLGFSTADTSGPTLTYSADSGGTAPYTDKLYRNTTSGFTPPGTGTLLATNPTWPYHDTTAPAGISYYKVYTTDSASGAATSNEQAASPWQAPLVPGFIGDSITADDPGNGTPPAQAAIVLSKIFGQRAITISNQGISGTYSGQWISGSSNLIAAKAAFAAAGVMVVSVMLGTNDARGDQMASASTYQSHMASMVNDLVGAGYIVILHYPPFVTPGSTAGGQTWSEASDALLQQYQPVIDGLCNGITVLQGDRTAYLYFAEFPAEKLDGIHPNTTGALTFGTIWGTAIYIAWANRLSAAVKQIVRPGYPTTGLSTLYATLENAGNMVNATTGSLMAATGANWPNGAIALSDSACPGRYAASVPANTPAGAYIVNFWLRQGAIAANTDPSIGSGNIYWDGTKEITPYAEVTLAAGQTVNANLAHSGTAQAGTTTTITLDAGASGSNAAYVGQTLYLTGGTGAGQQGTITAYNGPTKVATVAWAAGNATAPDNTTGFEVLAGSGTVNVSRNVSITERNITA